MCQQELTVLNRMLAVLSRSLPVYLDGMTPWSRRDMEDARGALAKIAAEDRDLATRLIDAIIDRGGQPDPGHFPIAFTAKNDLAIDFIVRDAIELQRKDVRSIDAAAAELVESSDLKPLIREIVGTAKRHLQELEELAIGDLSGE